MMSQTGSVRRKYESLLIRLAKTKATYVKPYNKTARNDKAGGNEFDPSQVVPLIG